MTATNISSGTVPTARLGTGTASSSTVLYGDNTWAAAGGGDNTPAFEAYMNATQTISDNTETAVEFDTENFDTDGAFDTSTYRFTPQTAGKYFVYTMVNTDGDANDNFQQGWCFIRKNGSKLLESRFDYRGGDGRCASTSVSQVVDLDGSTDYVDVYAAVNDTTGDPLIQGTQRFTVFGAYKLIGV